MTENVDGFFIPRHDQQAIVDLLREVPHLTPELAIVITEFDGYATRISYQPRIRSGGNEQPLPIASAAQDAADELRNTLWVWARHTCEHRGRDYDGGHSTDGIAHWLDRNIIALALTEGSEIALPSIEKAIRRVRRAISPGTDMDLKEPDQTKLDRARAWELNARAASQIAKGLGHEYRDLTKRRVLYLMEAHAIRPVRHTMIGKVAEPIFRLGDVLDAHIARRTDEVGTA